MIGLDWIELDWIGLDWIGLMIGLEGVRDGPMSSEFASHLGRHAKVSVASLTEECLIPANVEPNQSNRAGGTRYRCERRE